MDRGGGSCHGVIPPVLAPPHYRRRWLRAGGSPAAVSPATWTHQIDPDGALAHRYQRRQVSYVWTITSGLEAMSGHVVVNDLSEGQAVLDRLNALLRERFQIGHATIQIETGNHRDTESPL